VEEIDAQHRELFRRINGLVEAVRKSPSSRGGARMRTARDILKKTKPGRRLRWYGTTSSASSMT
jgi:hypothetical protein